MRVTDIMSRDLACCSPEATLQEAARMMLQKDCGSIPVCEGNPRRVVGVITDRDIAVRAVAAGKNPLECQVRDFMSHPVAVIRADASLEDAIRTMEDNQIRRIPVVESDNSLVGIVAQADIARTGQDDKTGELVQQLSENTSGARAL